MNAPLVLLHSPFVGPASWGTLPDALRAAAPDREVVVVDVQGDEKPPYGVRYVASVARRLAETGLREVVLVAHSGSGAVLPAVAGTQRAAHRRVAGYVLLDAVLPRAMPGNRLDLLRAEDAGAAEALEAELVDGGVFPAWQADDLREDVPDDVARDTLVAALRPRGLDFFLEPLPPGADWPDAPCGYLRTSPAYDVHARAAALRGWPVRVRDGGHFAGYVDPGPLAEDLLGLVAELGA